MVESIKHKGLREFYEKGKTAKIQQSHSPKLRRLLLRLQAASELKDLNFPGSGFHELKGKLKGHYALTVSGNYRLVFRFEKGDVFDIDYIDCH